VRHVFGGDEAPRLLLEQDEVLRHPARAGNVEDIHGESPWPHNLQGASAQCEHAGVDKRPALFHNRPAAGKRVDFACKSEMRDPTWSGRSISLGFCDPLRDRVALPT